MTKGRKTIQGSNTLANKQNKKPVAGAISLTNEVLHYSR